MFPWRGTRVAVHAGDALTVSGGDTSCLKPGLHCPEAAAPAAAGRRCHKTAPKNTPGAGETWVELGRAWARPWLGGKALAGSGGEPCTSRRALLPCQGGGHRGGHCGEWAAARAEGVPYIQPGLAELVHRHRHHPDFTGAQKCFLRANGRQEGGKPPTEGAEGCRSGAGCHARRWHPSWRGLALPSLGQGCREAECRGSGRDGEGDGAEPADPAGGPGAGLHPASCIAQDGPISAALWIPRRKAQLSVPQFPWQAELYLPLRPPHITSWDPHPWQGGGSWQPCCSQPGSVGLPAACCGWPCLRCHLGVGGGVSLCTHVGYVCVAEGGGEHAHVDVRGHTCVRWAPRTRVCWNTRVTLLPASCCCHQ